MAAASVEGKSHSYQIQIESLSAEEKEVERNTMEGDPDQDVGLASKDEDEKEMKQKLEELNLEEEEEEEYDDDGEIMDEDDDDDEEDEEEMNEDDDDEEWVDDDDDDDDEEARRITEQWSDDMDRLLESPEYIEARLRYLTQLRLTDGFDIETFPFKDSGLILPTPQEYYSTYIANLAKFAIQKENPALEFVSVVNSNWRGTRGRECYITFNAKDPAAGGNIQTYQTKLSQGLPLDSPSDSRTIIFLFRIKPYNNTTTACHSSPSCFGSPPLPAATTY